MTEGSPAVYYNPYAPDVREDPYPVYRELRTHAPVYRQEEFDFWALSRHRDITAAFLDSESFSNANGNSIEPVSWGPNAYRLASVLAMDPPGHTRIRIALAGYFSRGRVARLEPTVRRLVGEAVDDALSRDGFDFVGDLAERFPMRVLATIIGVPDAEHEKLRSLADDVVHRDAGAHDAPIAAIEATIALMEFFGALVAERRAHPGRHGDHPDLVGYLLTHDGPAGRVTDEEIVAFLNLLIAAGNDTVIQLLGNAWYWAGRVPAARALALSGHATEWVEETLRYDTPNQFAARMATRDIEVHGVRIPAGAKVLLLPGSANRDGEVFTDPERYDLTRKSANKRTFGLGRHFCLGSHLARLQAGVTLSELAARVADYEIDVAGAVRVPSAEAHGFLRLPTVVRTR